MSLLRLTGEWGASRARTISLPVLVALSMAGCATTSSAPPTAKPASFSTNVQGAAASCADLTASQQFAAAKVVFDGNTLPGATVPGTNGILASPARIRVEHYLKGSAPAEVTVRTAIKPVTASATPVDEDGIRPRAGQRWRIYARTTAQPYTTSICLGSRRLPVRTAHFSTAGLSFDYPATWHARSFPFPSAPFESWVVWLSPQPMHPPCVTRHGTHNTTITCGDPFSHLRPHSVLAYWTNDVDPAGRVRPAGGVPITVGGRPGRWLVQTGAARAPSLGATEVITVAVPTARASDSWYQLNALLRSPDTRELQAQLKTMLRSVRWRG